MTRCSCL